MLVEDEDSLRDVTCAYLTSKGYSVFAASESESAIAAAEGSVNPIDLLLSDVVLPGASGVHLAQQMSKTRPQLRVLYVSGYTADTIVHHGGHDPNFAFLTKPFSLPTLARKIRSILDPEQTAPASTAATAKQAGK